MYFHNLSASNCPSPEMEAIMSRHMVQDMIDISSEPDWKKINNFILACESSHNPKELVASILTNAVDICRFEQAIVFFMDNNKKVTHNHLVNFSQNNRDFYLNSYAYAKDNIKFSLVQEYRERPNVVDLILINWQDEEDNEFIKDYIRPLGLTYSLCLVFYDSYGNYRTVMSLDRFVKPCFTPKELLNMYCAFPHLANLHKNYFYKPENGDQAVEVFTKDNSNLTRREAEIANLLCDGMSPSNVSKTLYISIATTYKHISNIYEKLGISSQRELLALMLSK